MCKLTQNRVDVTQKWVHNSVMVDQDPQYPESVAELKPKLGTAGPADESANIHGKIAREAKEQIMSTVTLNRWTPEDTQEWVFRTFMTAGLVIDLVGIGLIVYFLKAWSAA